MSEEQTNELSSVREPTIGVEGKAVSKPLTTVDSMLVLYRFYNQDTGTDTENARAGTSQRLAEQLRIVLDIDLDSLTVRRTEQHEKSEATAEGIVQLLKQIEARHIQPTMLETLLEAGEQNQGDYFTQVEQTVRLRNANRIFKGISACFDENTLNHIDGSVTEAYKAATQSIAQADRDTEDKRRITVEKALPIHEIAKALTTAESSPQGIINSAEHIRGVVQQVVIDRFPQHRDQQGIADIMLRDVYQQIIEDEQIDNETKLKAILAGLPVQFQMWTEEKTRSNLNSNYKEDHSEVTKLVDQLINTKVQGDAISLVREAVEAHIDTGQDTRKNVRELAHYFTTEVQIVYETRTAVDTVLAEAQPAADQRYTALISEVDALLQMFPQDVQPQTKTRKEAQRSEIDEEVGQLLQSVDGLIQQVDNIREQQAETLRQWDLVKKRQEAANSSEAFYLEQLSHDPNPILRALVCSNSNTPSRVLNRIVEEGNPYMLLCIANNAKATPDLLDRLALSGIAEVVQAVVNNPNASPATKFKLNTRS